MLTALSAVQCSLLAQEGLSVRLLVSLSRLRARAGIAYIPRHREAHRASALNLRAGIASKPCMLTVKHQG